MLSQGCIPVEGHQLICRGVCRFDTFSVFWAPAMTHYYQFPTWWLLHHANCCSPSGHFVSPATMLHACERNSLLRVFAIDISNSGTKAAAAVSTVEAVCHCRELEQHRLVPTSWKDLTSSLPLPLRVMVYPDLSKHSLFGHQHFNQLMTYPTCRFWSFHSRSCQEDCCKKHERMMLLNVPVFSAKDTRKHTACVVFVL